MAITKQKLAFLAISILAIFNFTLMSASAQSVTSEHTPLNINIVWESVFENGRTESYTFMADPDNMITLIIVEETMQQGIVANLVADDNLTTISSMNLNVGGIIFCIPPDTSQYTLHLQNVDATNSLSYNALLTNDPSSLCSQNLIDIALSNMDTSSIEDLTNSDASTDENDSANLNNANSSDADPVVDVTVSNNNDASSVVDVNSNNNGNDNDNDDDDDDDDDDVVDVNVGGEEGEEGEETGCVATPDTSASTINVRVLPTTAASVVTTVSADELLNISGTIDDASWMQVSLTDGRSGFVSASILSLASVCVDITLPIVAVDQEEIVALEVAANVNASDGIDVDVTVGGEDAPVVDVTVGGEDAPVVDVTVGGEDAPVVDVTVGGEDAPVVDVTVGGEDAPVVDVNVGGEDAPVVDVNVGGEDAPVVDVNVGGEDAPVVDVTVGGEDAPVVDVTVGGEDDPIVDVEIGLP